MSVPGSMKMTQMKERNKKDILKDTRYCYNLPLFSNLRKYTESSKHRNHATLRDRTTASL